MIELLTILIILSTLVAIMIPRLWRTRDKAAYAGCITNLRDIATALQVYSNDNNQGYPAALSALTPNYIHQIPTCPMTGINTYSSGYTYSLSPVTTYTIVCNGNNHSTLGYTTNQPYFIFGQGVGP